MLLRTNWSAGTPPLGLLARLIALALVVALPLTSSAANTKRKVIIDEDCAGPGGTDMQALLALINSTDTDVLGITVMTGDAWRDEEVQHALRLLEIIGRPDIPVFAGAVFPIVNSKEATAEWEGKYGKIDYQGAWNYGHPVHGPWEIPTMAEGAPTSRPAKEDAAHFLVRMVHEYPNEVTIYEGGPLTNLALAETIDPEFASLARELILMGGSIHPVTNDPEFTRAPHREFNLWMDPEASRCALRAPWKRIVLTTVDISVKTHMDDALVAEIGRGTSPSARYVAKYAQECAFQCYLWDELAAVAWLDPSIITKSKKMYIDVCIDHGPAYGETLAWDPGREPRLHGPLVDVQEDLDLAKFYKEFLALMKASTPRAE